MKSVSSITILLLVGSFFASSARAQAKPAEVPSIVGKKTRTTAQGDLTSGKFAVYENRELKSGKIIHLDFAVLHASGANRQPDPVFYMLGGPGQAATSVAGQMSNHWLRADRDIVLICQRGTNGDNHLAFEFRRAENALQQFLEPIMDEATVKTNLQRLQKSFDLRMYSTPMAMDDINDFRKSMGYDKVNIMGGSYGTRACLVYLRRHGATVRTATLSGCAPIEYRNPLYHAEGAQRALDMMFDEVESNPKYREAFGDLRKKFKQLAERLEEQPAKVSITNQSSGESEPVTMNRIAFMEAVRFQMYYLHSSRALPRLLAAAHDGDIRPFVLNSLRKNIALRQSLALGMLLSVTSAEDVVRIDPDEVESLTANTFTGDGRVRNQMAAAAIWPKSKLPDHFGDPVQSEVPTLIFSGTIDPVTPPKWGEMVHKHFPNSVHVVVPTAHDIGGFCVDKIKQQFLKSGTVKDLPLDCVNKMKLPPLEMPKSK